MFELLTDLWNGVRYLKLFYPLLVLAILWYAWKLPRGERCRKYVLTAALGLFIWSWFPVAWLNTYFLERPYRQASSAPSVDAIVVLSGAAAAPTPPFPYGVLLESTVRRTRQAAHLAEQLPDTPVMACGPEFSGAPRHESVAHEMAELLVGWGVQPERIWLEEVGVSTASQSVEAAKILRARGVKKILLVTDAFHMRRAAACFRKAGFETFAAPSHIHSQSNMPRLADFLPSTSAVALNEEAMREWLALTVYKIRGVI